MIEKFRVILEASLITLPAHPVNDFRPRVLKTAVQNLMAPR